MIGFPLLEVASQHVLNSVNLGRDVSGREARNLTNCGSVEALEIGQNHVAVQRFQGLDQIQQAVEHLTAGGCDLPAVRIRQVLQLFQSDQRLRSGAALSQDSEAPTL